VREEFLNELGVHALPEQQRGASMAQAVQPHGEGETGALDYMRLRQAPLQLLLRRQTDKLAFCCRSLRSSLDECCVVWQCPLQ
jgi:hypothetical protein